MRSRSYSLVCQKLNMVSRNRLDVASMTTNLLRHYSDQATRFVSIQLIEGDQKYISPRKGFSCAYRIQQGGESCSQYAKRQIQKRGLLNAIALVGRRFQACKAAGLTLQSRAYSVGNQRYLIGTIRGKYIVAKADGGDCATACSGCVEVTACCYYCSGDNPDNRDTSF